MYKHKKYYSARFITAILMALAVGVLPISGRAQHADSLALFRKFMQVCNSYKQLPVHVTVEVQNAADIMSNPQEDTASFSMEFFIRPNGAYIKMGNDEQVINDSFIVYIERGTRRMLLYPNTGGIASQMNRFAAGLLQDSNVAKFAARYTASQLADTLQRPGISTIKIVSRDVVPGTRLSKETIEATYADETKLPLTLVQLHRKMIPLDSATYSRLLQNPVYSAKLVHPGGIYYFLIKSVSSTYSFRQYRHGEDVQLPLQVSSCIIKSDTGRFAPAKGYESFALSENL